MDSIFPIMEGFPTTYLADCLCLLYLSVDIAGSGDPLYVAELCKWLEKVKWSDFFAKKAFHIQIFREKARNRTKNGQNPPKKAFLSATMLQLLRNSANGEHHLRNSVNGAHHLQNSVNGVHHLRNEGKRCCNIYDPGMYPKVGNISGQTP